MTIRIGTITLGDLRVGPQGPPGPPGTAVPHNDLDGRDISGAHPASVVTYDPTASGLVATDAQAAIDEVVATAIRPVAPIEIDDTAYTLTAADHGRTLLYTHASGCTVTVPDDLEPGHTVEHRARGGAAVAFVAGGTTTLAPSPGCIAEIMAGGVAFTSVEPGAVCAVVGELEESP